MKKTLLVSILLVVGMAVAFGSQPEPKEAQATKLRKEVYQKVKYPAVASENEVEGDVWVSFKVDEKGKIKVHDASSLEKSLRDDVVKQLNKMKVSPDLHNSEDLYLMKFKFELV